MNQKVISAGEKVTKKALKTALRGPALKNLQKKAKNPTKSQLEEATLKLQNPSGLQKWLKAGAHQSNIIKEIIVKSCVNVFLSYQQGKLHAAMNQDYEEKSNSSLG